MIKKVEMFILSDCPYCHEARRLVDELAAENPRYKAVLIEEIDERVHKKYAGSKDYYYVPTYYVDGVKLHEGVPTRDKIREVLDAAL